MFFVLKVVAILALKLRLFQLSIAAHSDLVGNKTFCIITSICSFLVWVLTWLQSGCCVFSKNGMNQIDN